MSTLLYARWHYLFVSFDIISLALGDGIAPKNDQSFCCTVRGMSENMSIYPRLIQEKAHEGKARGSLQLGSKPNRAQRSVVRRKEPWLPVPRPYII